MFRVTHTEFDKEEQQEKKVEQMNGCFSKHEVEQTKSRILDGFKCNNAHPQF